MDAVQHVAVEHIDVRRPLTTVTLVLVALIAALAVWSGLAWASNATVPSPSQVPRVVFMQATDPGGAGGHHCHNGGGSGDTAPAPATAGNASAAL